MSDLKELLSEVYRQDGPRESFRGKLRVVPPKRFAKLKPEDVDLRWDFDRRHLMHRIAQAIAYR